MLQQFGQVAKSADHLLADFRSNLERELKALDENMKSAGKKAGLGDTFVRDVLERGRDPQLSYVARLADKHGLSLDRLLGLSPARRDADKRPIEVVGEVGAGRWKQVNEMGELDFAREESPFPPDPRFPQEAQFDLIVRGNSINNFARDGERLRCVDLERAGLDVYDDDLVIFRKTNADGLIETTAKRFRRRGPIIELWPDSHDPMWQAPERIDTRKARHTEEGGIVALVLYSYNPARLGRRR